MDRIAAVHWHVDVRRCGGVDNNSGTGKRLLLRIEIVVVVFVADVIACC